MNVHHAVEAMSCCFASGEGKPCTGSFEWVGNRVIMCNICKQALLVAAGQAIVNFPTDQRYFPVQFSAS